MFAQSQPHYEESRCNSSQKNALLLKDSSKEASRNLQEREAFPTPEMFQAVKPSKLKLRFQLPTFPIVHGGFLLDRMDACCDE